MKQVVRFDGKFLKFEFELEVFGNVSRYSYDEFLTRYIMFFHRGAQELGLKDIELFYKDCLCLRSKELFDEAGYKDYVKRVKKRMGSIQNVREDLREKWVNSFGE